MDTVCGAVVVSMTFLVGRSGRGDNGKRQQNWRRRGLEKGNRVISGRSKKSTESVEKSAAGTGGRGGGK